MESENRDPLSVHRRARVRRRARGAAALEGAVAIPLFLILLAASAFTVRLYASTAHARSEARHAAWAYALNACEGGEGEAEMAAGSEESPSLEAALEVASGVPESDLDGGEMAEFTEAEGAMTDPDGLSRGTFVGDLRDGGGNLELGDRWGVARATLQGQTVRAGILPMGDIEPQVTFEVQCNEKKRDAEILEVLGFLWRLHNTFVLWE